MKALLPLIALLALSLDAPAQDWAKARLEASPRHGEWVNVKNGDREVRCFVVYPEKSGKTPVVILIHEIFGLTDWVRGLADQVAAEGYIAIAPDFLSGQSFASVDDARGAIGKLPPEQVMGDLDAAVKYARSLPASNGKVGVAGFCWGGGKAFAYAAHNPGIQAAYVFYGPGPQDAAGVKPITCPVYGFYAENDARINEALPKTEELMKAGNKTFDYKIYTGGGHGFMRAGEAPDASEGNRTARADAWARWQKLLTQLN